MARRLWIAAERAFGQSSASASYKSGTPVRYTCSEISRSTLQPPAPVAAVAGGVEHRDQTRKFAQGDRAAGAHFGRSGHGLSWNVSGGSSLLSPRRFEPQA